MYSTRSNEPLKIHIKESSDSDQVSNSEISNFDQNHVESMNGKTPKASNKLSRFFHFGKGTTVNNSERSQSSSKEKPESLPEI
mmetsp:Transcript_5609/g.4754  ORF Transcript_5609/g.4754 Transcript_5609/m.4754 type:complete len:83 (+) Transcript_5609:1832-2080(+)